MKDRLNSLIPQICVERARFLTESFKDTEGEPIIIRKAKALQKILTHITVNIWPDELIVGCATSKEVGGGFYPECNGRIWPELDGISSRETNPFLIDPKDLEEIKNTIIPYWSDKTLEDYARKSWTNELISRVNILGSGMVLTEVAGLGHVLLNHEKVIRIGLSGIIEEIDRYSAQTKEEEKAKQAFYEAAKISCQSVIVFAQRYAAKAEELAKKEGAKTRKDELSEIARICRKVPEFPAETLWEGLQAIYLVHLVAQIEDYEKSISFGGIDRYIYPLYEKDLKSGRLSREKAQTLLECFFVKLNSTAPCFDFAGDLGFCSIQSATNLIVGGIDSAGNDVVNDLSFLAIDASENVCMHEPNFGARIHKKTNPKFLERVSQSAATGKGHLQIFNDDVIIPTLIEWGVAPGDAANYGVIGCVELGVPGKTCNSANAALLDMAYCLELALNQGKKLSDNFMSPFLKGEQMGPKTKHPKEMRSIDDVIDAFSEQTAYLVKNMIQGMDVLAKVHAEHHPLPFISSLTENCVNDGKDMMWGGAVYNYTTIQGIGMATVGDSIAAIDHVVFKNKKVDMGSLVNALSNNFEGTEPLRQLLIHKCPKFGNDNPEADMYTQKVVEIFCNEVRKYKTHRGGRYQPGFFSSGGHVAFGLTDSASPSGRKAGEPLSVGVSPSQGMNVTSPTAALKSAAKIDYSLITNGAALNLEFHPNFFHGQEGVKNFQSLLTTFFDLGGMHLQCNMVDRDTLLTAKESPERYKDLIVRPAGFSVCFVCLNPLIQDEIISRTEYQ
jgi:formate C-acetyltransferase